MKFALIHGGYMMMIFTVCLQGDSLCHDALTHSFCHHMHMLCAGEVERVACPHPSLQWPHAGSRGHVEPGVHLLVCGAACCMDVQGWGVEDVIVAEGVFMFGVHVKFF